MVIGSRQIEYRSDLIFPLFYRKIFSLFYVRSCVDFFLQDSKYFLILAAVVDWHFEEKFRSKSNQMCHFVVLQHFVSCGFIVFSILTIKKVERQKKNTHASVIFSCSCYETKKKNNTKKYSCRIEFSVYNFVFAADQKSRKNTIYLLFMFQIYHFRRNSGMYYFQRPTCANIIVSHSQ